MKKRRTKRLISPITIVIVCIVICILALTSCNDCIHAYDNECDEECDLCGKQREVEGHDWADADCDTPKTCKSCETVEGEALGHSPEEDDGDCTTDILCSVCSQVIEAGANSHQEEEDDGDCTTAIGCKNCSQVAKEAKEHSFGIYYNSNESHHWYACLNKGCLEKQGYEEHISLDDGDCTTTVKCEDCKWIFVRGKEHVLEEKYSSDEDYHWIACSNEGCNGTPKEPHNGEYTDLENGTHSRGDCEICLATFENEAHSFGNDIECVCGAYARVRVDDTFYYTLEEALENWIDGTTLTLYDNIEYTGKTISITEKSVTLDLNGCYIVSEDAVFNVGGESIDIVNDIATPIEGSLTIIEGGGGGYIEGGHYTIRVYGDLTLKAGRVKGLITVGKFGCFEMTGGMVASDEAASLPTAVSVNGEANISGGTISGRIALHSQEGGKINISGNPTIQGNDYDHLNSGASIYVGRGTEVTISGTPTLVAGSFGQFLLDDVLILNTQPEYREEWEITILSGSTGEFLKPGSELEGELDIERFTLLNTGIILEKKDNGSIAVELCMHNGNFLLTKQANGTHHHLVCYVCLKTIKETHAQVGTCKCGFVNLTITGEDKEYEYSDNNKSFDLSTLFEMNTAVESVSYELTTPEDDYAIGQIVDGVLQIETIGTYVVTATVEGTRDYSGTSCTITIVIISPAGSGEFDGEWVSIS